MTGTLETFQFSASDIENGAKHFPPAPEPFGGSDGHLAEYSKICPGINQKVSLAPRWLPGAMKMKHWKLEDIYSKVFVATPLYEAAIFLEEIVNPGLWEGTWSEN